MDLNVTGVTLEEHAGEKRVRVVCNGRARLTFELLGNRAVVIHSLGDTPQEKLTYAVRIAMWKKARELFLNPTPPVPVYPRRYRRLTTMKPQFPAWMVEDARHHSGGSNYVGWND